MKKSLLIFLILLVSFNTIQAQNSLSETEKLAATAKVWGFLKYYHPRVADGKYDWDAELFKILPKVKSSSTKEELSHVFMTWIDELGKVKECKKCEIVTRREYFDENFDLSWWEDEQRFTTELSERLKYIEANRHQGKKYYVSKLKGVGNIEILHEQNHEELDWEDENLRLLSLFRYWNIVEYFFPYKYQTDTDWDDVLTDMIPKFMDLENEQKFYLALLELAVNLDDSHAGFYNDKTRPYFGDYWIPASFKIIEGNAIITRFYNDSLARQADLRIGDIITKVNDKPVQAIFDEREQYINGSNSSRKKHNAFMFIFNGPTDSVKIEYVRNNQTSTKSIKRYLVEELIKEVGDPETFEILDGNIGYVNMGILDRENVAQTMEALRDTKAIIFDVRNYPKGTLYEVASYISSESNNFFKVTAPDLDYPGKFIWRDGRQSLVAGRNAAFKYQGKVVLVTNEAAQSHAEFTIMCLQTGDNVTTIGSQTSGADGNVSSFNMVEEYKTGISGIGIFYPDKTETQRKGVKIDIEVKPTIQGIIDGRDEVLEKAIEYVNGKQ